MAPGAIFGPGAIAYRARELPLLAYSVTDSKT
jgi:hypothetical protein